MMPGRFIDGLRKDLSYALRLLMKSPAFTLVAIASLSLGIGANTAIFSLLNAVAFRSLAVPHPERLVQIASTDSKGGFELLSYTQLKALRGRQTVFSSLSGWLLPVLNIEVNGVPSRSVVLVVTEDYYSTFPVHPVLGRTLSPPDWHSQLGGITNVAVISYQCWEKHFGRDPAVLGKTVRVEGKPFSIIGVMPARFSSPQIDVSADVTIPVEISPLALLHNKLGFDPNTAVLFISARLRKGVSLREASAQLAVLWRTILKDTQPPKLSPMEAADYFSRRIRVEPGTRGQSFLRNRFTDTLNILMTAVAILLLLACLNVATLLLARSSARAPEISLRLALGAGCGRVMQQLFIESLLLSAASGFAGALFALWFSRMLLAFMWSSPIPLTISVDPDGRVLAFTIAVAAAAAIVFGLAPGWVTIKETLNSGLRQGTRSIMSQRGSWLRRTLIAGQVALTVAMLVSAGLLLRMTRNLRTADLGFQPQHVAVLFLSRRAGGYRKVDMDAYERELLIQVSSVSGVSSAAISNWLPVNGSDWTELISRPTSAGESGSLKSYVQAVSYGFFETMGTPIVRGREFSKADSPATKRVVIISESLARRLFPAGDAVGRTISVGQDKPHRNLGIVGIAHDARFGNLDHVDPLIAYLPIFQDPKLLQYAVLEIRAATNPVSLVPSVDRMIRALGREYSFGAESLEHAIDINLAGERMLASLSTFFGLVALCLAVIGLYGLLAFTVRRRVREFGVRMALGADPLRIFRSILGEAFVLLLAGVAAGIPLAFAAERMLSSRLPGFKADDPVFFVAAPLLLIAVGCSAAAIPARRAAAVNPAEALRAE